MVQKELGENSATIDIENIGGIDQAKVELNPGVTLLTGRNATNRTSFLQAVMAVTGSDNATLKADADEGGVSLDINGETYTRTLTRQSGHTSLSGDPYLADPTLADLFAFLLETNECRQAVARGDDLREIIMRPVDTEEIERQIQQLEDERESVDDKLSELEELSRRSPELEEERQDIKSQIEEKESQLASKQEDLNDLDKTIEESREENEELDRKITELQNARKDFQRVQQNIESEKESIDALQNELAEQEEAFEEMSPVSEDRIASLDQEMQRARGQVEAIDQTINELQSVIEFNNQFLEEGQPEILQQLDSDNETADGTITDKLVSESETLTCWTCGSDVAVEQIESNVEKLRSLHQQKMQERQSLKEDIQEFQSEKNDLETQQQRYQNLDRTIEQTEDEIADRKETLENLKTQKEEVSSEVTELEADVEDLQKEDHSEILEVQEEINHLEFELNNLKSKLSSITDEIESIENQLDERDELEAQRADIKEELADLRTRVERLQEQAIEEFNDHMEAVLDLLDYENLERIWIERTKETVREGRRKVDQDRFKLHVVRSTESDTVYEDTVDHLSESEREVTGLVFALAGYLVHKVYETVPFMLIDSIEAIDADRIASLVEYLEEYADYLIVALLNEDAAALDDGYPRVTSI